LKIFESETAKL